MRDMTGRTGKQRKPRLLTPNDIREATFTVHCLRGGYDTDQVDDLLDQAANTIAVLGQEINRLNQQAKEGIRS